MSGRSRFLRMSAGMATLTLRLCGDCVLTPAGDDPSTSLLRGKALALLAFLTVEPRAHRREVLTALLWGEHAEEKAKASFRQALTRLRTTLGDALRSDRMVVELRRPIPCDVMEFLALARNDPGAAVMIDVPGFLSGLSVSRAPAFEEWADKKRAELLARYRDVLRRSIADAISGRDWQRASNLASRWVELDPRAGDAAAALVESQFLGGDSAAARGTYRQYILRLEPAGRRPGRAIRELMSRIDRADAARVADRTPEPSAAAPSFRVNLLGRSAEWEALSRSWSAARSGCSIVVIEGEPGAGKTRLVDDFFRCAEVRGGVVLRGRGHDASLATPYSAVIDLVRSAIHAPGLAGVDPRWLAELANLVPELRSRFSGLPVDAAVGEARRRPVFEAISQVIQALAEENTLAVVIDNLHWCDRESCELLHALVRRFENAPMFWCATFAPGVVERDAPAARLIRSLGSWGGATAIRLDPLTASDVARLVSDVVRSDASNGASQLAARVFDLTAGNPFYIIGLLERLAAEGGLTWDAASQKWDIERSVLESDVPLGAGLPVHQVVAERIACLPEELGAVLITLAVSGHGCRTHALSHVHGISRLRAAALGDRLVERRLATELNGAYQCAHPIIARVVRADLTSSRRQEVHRALALSLELLLPADANSDALQEIVRHAELAGEGTMARRYALNARESSPMPL